jgi:predicted alpha/beta-hydrolase family hydrolase
MAPLPFHISTGAGVLTATRYHADRGACSGLLVLAHGAGAGQQSPFMRRFAAVLASRGLEVVTFDFPYMAAGRRVPDRTPVLEETFRDVLRGAAAHAPGPATRLFIGGKSMGGRIATHLAAAPDAWPLPRPLAGVIVLGYPLLPPGRRDAGRAAHLHRLAAPALIVQGTRDSFGGPDAIEHATAGARDLTVLAIEGGDHSFTVLKRLGRDQRAVYDEIADGVMRWVSGR